VNETSEVKIRRAPKLSVFLIVGALVGALTTLIVTSQFPADPAIGFAASVGYFLLFGIPAGLVLGAAVGLIIDRVSIARARTVVMEHEVVEPSGDAAKPDAAEPEADAAPAKPASAKRRSRKAD
jgi:F0F1-type ATP synthase assembly protein I